MTQPGERMTARRAAAIIAEHTREIGSPGRETPRLSVCLVTYKHERFIREALDSVFMQQTSFPLEVVIGDDHSTDRTSEIALDYQRRYCDRTRVLLAAENLGRHTGNGRLNFLRTLRACRGEYVAFLEGDDYWTDPCKLQKQVDFLDAHPECSMCCHAAMYVDDDTNQPSRRFPEFARPFSTLDDLLGGQNFIQTCSIVARRALLADLPEWFLTITLGDWPLCCLLARAGSIGFLDEAMTVYRMHRSSLWSSKPEEIRCEAVVSMYEVLRSNLGSQCFDPITRTLARAQIFLSSRARQSGDEQSARSHIRKGLGFLFELAQDDDCLAKEVIEEVVRAALPGDDQGVFTRIAALVDDLARARRELAVMRTSVFWRLRERLVILPGFKQLAHRMGARDGP